MNNLRRFLSSAAHLSSAQFTTCLLLLLLLITACGTNSATAPEAGLPGEALPSPQEQSGTGADATQEQASIVDETPPEALSMPVLGVNPCELLTTPEVEAALGEPLASFDRSTIFSYESCDFKGQSGGTFITLQLTHQNAEQFKKDNEETSAMFEAELLPIEGLGDEAAFYSGLLRVRVGETVVQIATWHPEAEQDQALIMTQELARIVLERLP
jgi:hypothetical protein